MFPLFNPELCHDDRPPSLFGCGWRPRYALLKSNSSLSPSKTRLIYWEDPKRLKWNDPNRLKTPTATPDPYGLADEDVDWIASGEDEIFLLQDGIADPIYPGKIKGVTTNAHWLPGEQRVILEMLPFSPYYLWLVDIPSRTVTPLLSSKDVFGAQKFAFLGVSPDGNQAMYQINLAKHIFIVNINTALVQPIYAVPRTHGAWWLPDGKRILAVIFEDERNYSIILYNMETEELTRLVSDLENGRFTLLSLSNHEVMLTYDETIVRSHYSHFRKIYLLKLCLDN